MSTPLKKLPRNVSKKELHSLYPEEHPKRLNRFANEVMAEHQKKDYKLVKRNRNLTHVEWVMLIEILGYPEGYEKEFR